MIDAPEKAAAHWEDAVRLLCALPTMSERERIDAVVALVRSDSPTIRKRAHRLGADILPDDLPAAWLREGADDVLRNAGMEILKVRGSRSFALARQLAEDEDDDVVLQATLLLDHCRDPRGVPVLKSLLSHRDPNVVQAAITALGHHRDPAVIKELTRFLDSDPWLQMAALRALGDIGDPGAIPILEPFLWDEFLESFASESIACIGGARAFRVLAAHWLRNETTIDAERYVSLLAWIEAQLQRPVRLDGGLEELLMQQLWHQRPDVRAAAAAVILASKSTIDENRALHVLVSSDESSFDLPPCLSQRPDLFPLLLRGGGAMQEWGLQLAAIHADSADLAEIARAVLGAETPQHLSQACMALMRSSNPEAAEQVVTIFDQLPVERRVEFHGAVVHHGPRVLEVLSTRTDVDSKKRLILSILAGADVSEAVRNVEALPAGERSEIVAQLLLNRNFVRALPWASWVAEDASLFAPLLADAIIDAGFVEGDALLRKVAKQVPTARVIEALACLGSETGVDLLEDMLDRSDPRIRAFICIALGNIGGDRVRSIFRRISSGLPQGEAKFAYRAWASCAEADDVSCFLEVVRHPDWLVRAAAAEVLARFANPSLASPLAALALDPVEAVAAKAIAISNS